MRLSSEQEFGHLSERTDLSPAHRAAAWAEVRQQTQTALAAIFGVVTAADYLKKHSDWLKASPPNPGGNP